MPYTTKAKIESYTGESIDATLATLAINWATDWINRYTGRNFEQVTETRYFDLQYGNDVFIDPFTELTEVKILNEDGSVERTLTAGAGNDYVITPFNQTGKYNIRLNRHGAFSRFPYRGRSLMVTGTWGYPNGVPPVIEMVATQLAAGLGSDLVGKEITSQSLGDYSVSYAKVDEKAQEMGIMQSLDMYREIEV